MNQVDIRISEAEISKINLSQGDTLIVKFTDDTGTISASDLDNLKEGLQNIFPNNKVVVLLLPTGSKMEMDIVQQVISQMQPAKELELNCGPGPMDYCSTCACGKKEAALSKKGE